MKRIGFIDLQPSSQFPFPISIYVFKDNPTGYEFESTIKYSDEGAFSLSASQDDIGEFYLSLPLELLDFRIVKLPFSGTEKIRKVIPFELDSLIMDGSDSVVFDSIVLGSSDDDFRILVAYVKKEILKDILTKLASLNIDPRIVTSIELQAVIRNGEEEIAARLMNQKKLDSDERVSRSREELSAHTINLRTGLFAYTKDAEKFGKLLKLTSVLFMLLVLVINFDLTFRIITTKGETSSIKKEMRNIYTDLFPGEKKIRDELYQMKSHMKELQEKMNTLKSVSPLQLMSKLSQETIPGVVINEINIDRGLITIKGEAGSLDETGKIKIRLSEFLTDVSITDIKPSRDGKTFFTVVAKNLE